MHWRFRAFATQKPNTVKVLKDQAWLERGGRGIRLGCLIMVDCALFMLTKH